MKGIIVFKGKYGATQQYASWLAEELQLPVVNAEEITPDKLRVFDFVILAGSVYIGKWMLRDWLRANLNILRRKKIFAMIVCGTPASNKSEQTNLAKNNIPVVLHDQVETFFLPGRLVIRKLSWFDRFMLKMGARIQKDPTVRERMLCDVDNVSRENLDDAIRTINSYQFNKYASSRVWRHKMVSEN
jgi:menaquinone-dependent protoporphyrinogen IX oxidase